MKKVKNKKNTHGGPGRGQGRRFSFGEPTVVIAIRCPQSKVDELKKSIDRKLSKWKVNE